jgi:hypothetical protein
MDSSALASSIAALRSSIRALESRSDSLEDWLYLWVALVVIGVVLEVGFVLWEYHEDMEEFRRGIIHSPHRPTGRKLLVELLGACLVAIGVAGELAIDVMGGRLQTDLRTKNGDLVHLLEQVSSAALQRAADAEANTLREINARIALERDVVWEGPRDVLLTLAQGMFNKRLRHSPRQRFRTWVCEGQLNVPNDIMRSTIGLGSVLSQAGWREVQSSPMLPAIGPFIRRACFGQGVFVNVRTNAPPETRRAALDLARLLHDVLREHRAVSVGRSDIEPPDQLPEDVIEVWVGAHEARPFDVP